MMDGGESERTGFFGRFVPPQRARSDGVMEWWRDEGLMDCWIDGIGRADGTNGTAPRGRGRFRRRRAG